LSPSKVPVEPHLAPERFSSTHLLGLASLGVADLLRRREELPSVDGRHEQHAVVVAEDDILPRHSPLSDRGGVQRIRGTVVEALRAGGDRSEAKQGQPDRSYVDGVAVQSPNDDSLQPSARASRATRSPTHAHRAARRCRRPRRLQVRPLPGPQGRCRRYRHAESGRPAQRGGSPTRPPAMRQEQSALGPEPAGMHPLVS